MKPELKEKWVKALRSGRYEQTDGVLTSVVDGRERNCCLGVLCRVVRVPRAEWGDKALLSDVYEERPQPLHQDLGLTYDQEQKLAVKNDRGLSFAEIADYIEENL